MKTEEKGKEVYEEGGRSWSRHNKKRIYISKFGLKSPLAATFMRCHSVGDEIFFLDFLCLQIFLEW